MRGFPLGGPDRRLRVDFADTEHRYQQQFLQPLPLQHYEIVAESFVHRATPEAIRVRERTPPPLHFRERELYAGAEWPVPAIRERVRTPAFEPLEHLEHERRREAWSLDMAWNGMLLLKNSNFPASMHLLEGDLSIANSLLIDGSTGGKVTQLRITQRLRLDQPKIDEVSRRIKVAGPGGYAVLLAVPGSSEETSSSDPAASTQRPLRNLVSYLKQKQAAGVISLPVGGSRDKDNTGVLHAFPPCDFSQQFLDSSAKALAKTEEDFLVMIIVRGAS
uniref:RNA binding motif protein 15 n=1 Tax=Sinocyclocheilus anshuiensis TaxID=1608454 RepID=A0A671NHV8_9TELE